MKCVDIPENKYVYHTDAHKMYNKISYSTAVWVARAHAPYTYEEFEQHKNVNHFKGNANFCDR